MESTVTSNRRQPVRQTRTNPQRTSTQVIPSTSAVEVNDGLPAQEIGFFPAITHFTDAITALPREMIRHYTMLKEVDAKLYAPEEKLSAMLSVGLKSPAPRLAQRQNEIEPLPAPTDDSFNHSRFARRRLFRDMRAELSEIVKAQDEKNHVMNTAIDGLHKQLKCCQSSFSYIDDEISEEARLGSMTHWAYNTEKLTEKKSMIGSERTRRAANNFAAETDAAAMRSEARRDALAARRGRNQNIDSDFDDSRLYGKKTQNGGKGRKGDPVVGLGISGSGPPNKRRRVEQLGAGGVAMGRSPSAAYASNARGASPAVDTRKKPRSGVATNGRKRGGTIDSPIPASSPIMGTFTTGSKNNRENRSPAPSYLQRIPSSRARQTSAQGANPSLYRNRSTSNINARTPNGIHAETTNFGKSAGPETRHSREPLPTKGEHIHNDMDGGNDSRSNAHRKGSRDANTTNHSSNNTSRTRGDRPPSISTRGGGGGAGSGGGGSKNPSKNATPLATSFTTDSRRKRETQPPKRSHKKGAGINAQKARKVNGGQEDYNINGDEEMEDDGDGSVGDDGTRYCFCNEVSYGQMVGCDNDDCPRQWFHWDCVGLSKAPVGEWFCADCRRDAGRR